MEDIYIPSNMAGRDNKNNKQRDMCNKSLRYLSPPCPSVAQCPSLQEKNRLPLYGHFLITTFEKLNGF